MRHLVRGLSLFALLVAALTFGAGNAAAGTVPQVDACVAPGITLLNTAPAAPPPGCMLVLSTNPSLPAPAIPPSICDTTNLGAFFHANSPLGAGLTGFVTMTLAGPVSGLISQATGFQGSVLAPFGLAPLPNGPYVLTVSFVPSDPAFDTTVVSGGFNVSCGPLPPIYTFSVFPIPAGSGQLALNASFTNNFGPPSTVTNLTAQLTLGPGLSLASGANPMTRPTLADGDLWFFTWTVNAPCGTSSFFDVFVDFDQNAEPGAHHFGPFPLNTGPCGPPPGPEYAFQLTPTPAGGGQTTLAGALTNNPGGLGTVHNVSALLQLGPGLTLASGDNPMLRSELADGATWSFDWLIGIGCGPDSFFDIFLDLDENQNPGGAAQQFHYDMPRPDCVGPAPPPPEVTVEAPFTTPDGLPIVFSGVPTVFSKDVVDHCVGKKPVKSVELTLHPEFGADIVVLLDHVGPGEVWSKAVTPSGHGLTSLTFHVTCDDDSLEIQIGGNIFIDPSGTVVNACTNAPLGGATVTLLKETSPGLFNVPVTSEHIPAINPQVTAPNGVYGWLVVAGNWKLHVDKLGYFSADSAVLTIPPEVTGLVIALTPIAGCDTTAPVIQPHGNVHAITNDPIATGLNVGYTPPNVTDNVDPTHPAFCTPGPGSFFAIGHTQVKCVAQDLAGNKAAPTFFDVFVEFVPLNQPPTVLANGPYFVAEGGSVTLNATGSDLDGDTISYAWDLDNNGTFETPGQSVVFSAAGRDGPSQQDVRVRVTDPDGASSTDGAAVMIQNVSPDLLLSGPGSVNESPATVTYSYSATDPGGLNDPLTFTFACGPGGFFALGSDTGTTFGCVFPDGPASPNVQVTVNDGDGGNDTAGLGVNVANVDPTVTVNGPTAVGESQTARTYTYTVGDPAGPNDPLVLTRTCDGGTIGSVTPSSFTCVFADGPASHDVRVDATDGDGGSGFDELAVAVGNANPVITSITGPTDPVAAGSSVTLSALWTDPGTPDTQTATWSWGDGSPSTTTTAPAGGSGAVSAAHTYALGGVYTVTLTLTDKDGGQDTALYEFVTVFSGTGFVTGGGQINSPAGAYTPNSSLTGKATFGFVSKYLPGRQTPDGNTQFQFHAASFTFNSSSYDFLVVSGWKAQYRGAGAVNGVGGYSFIVTAYDGDRPGGDGIDRFRIKVWNGSGVVYDNKLGAGDGIDSVPQALLKGSIVIHRD